MIGIKEFLRSEVAPALGCTEPVCVALACAYAGSILPHKNIEKIELILSPGIFKNGMGVFLPGTDLTGIHYAAAIGAMFGDPKKDLEVFSNISSDHIDTVKKFIAKQRVQIDIDFSKKGIFVCAKIFSNKDVSEAIIKDYHNNLVSLKLNGENIAFEKKNNNKEMKKKIDVDEITRWMKKTPCEDLIDLIYELDDEDFEFLKKGVLMNLQLMEKGQKEVLGYGIYACFEDLEKEQIGTSILEEVQKNVCAAIDARMAGAAYPAMSSAGSGNNGLVATLPIWTVHNILKTPEEEFLRAIALSHLFTSKLKSHMGRITPICSCGLSAGGGATAGITYLYTKDKDVILNAVEMLVVNMFGILCDGAKPGCSIKLLIATHAAMQCVYLSLKGKKLFINEGICGKDIDDTLKNLEFLCSNSYTDTDRLVITIMKNKGLK